MCGTERYCTDGFNLRNIISCPSPPDLTVDQMMGAPELPHSLSLLLYVIYRVCLNERTFTLGENATRLYNEIFTVLRYLIRELNFKDTFLRYNI